MLNTFVFFCVCIVIGWSSARSAPSFVRSVGWSVGLFDHVCVYVDFTPESGATRRSVLFAPCVCVSVCCVAMRSGNTVATTAAAAAAAATPTMTVKAHLFNRLINKLIALRKTFT